MKLRFKGSLPTHIPTLNMSLTKGQIIEEHDLRVVKKLKSTKLFEEVKDKKTKAEVKITEEVNDDYSIGL
jgi:hypothetical protein